MITLRPEYPVEQIGEKQLHAIREDNRVMSTLKQIVANWDFEKNDIEDLAELCWRCGFKYASDRFFHLAPVSFFCCIFVIGKENITI